MDAIDGALVHFPDNNFKLIDYQQYPIPENIRTALKEFSGETTIDQISRLDVRLGRLFGETALLLLKKNNIEHNDIKAIGSHGQTILHRPETPEPYSLQIADPNIIAHMTGIKTVSDFRRMDIAAGGQGAPLAPIFHSYLFHHQTTDRVILNIGGMANITVLPAMDKNHPVLGFDTGPGNVLLDAWIRRHTGREFDKDGRWAATGKVNNDLLNSLLDDEYFKMPPPKSTGRDYFNMKWLEHKLECAKQSLSPQDIQATLLKLTVTSIISAIERYAKTAREIYVCGGGVHNLEFMKCLSQQLADCIVKTTEESGINPDAVEAMTFAWLAKCRLEGLPGNLPSVTGAKLPCVLGAIYSASNA
ncbi:MAG: hypothetical protein HW411_861 [Gammaproteobacteria bacterium]|nr:hypothetical protein [Gammaproteobacteria bacterium]